MKLGLMQPYFFPYIGYFQLIQAVDSFIVYDDVAFIKQGWINRNRLLPLHGQPVYFNVPLKGAGSFQKIRSIEIFDDGRWRPRLLKMIQHNYKSASYFEETFPLIKDLILTEEQSLSGYNLCIMRGIAGHLDIGTDIRYEPDKYQWLESALAAEPSALKHKYAEAGYASESKVIRILEICKHEGADTYVNAIGGQALYDREIFCRSGVALLFVNTLPYQYDQRSEAFYPHLSIIDVLMNCGRENTKKMLCGFTLI